MRARRRKRRAVFASGGCAIRATTESDELQFREHADGHGLRRNEQMPSRTSPLDTDGIVLPFRLRVGDVVLEFRSTTMVFGTPIDVTLSEIAIETFFPADDFIAQPLVALAGG